jgi:DNA-binding CsgD family transcriptional regulator
MGETLSSSRRALGFQPISFGLRLRRLMAWRKCNRCYGTRSVVHARPVSCPMLVGRERELESLHAARRGLAQSHPAFVLVGGEAGIGKSRLLAQFARGTGDRRSRTVVAVQCLEHARQPFGPVRDAVAALARAAETALPPILARFIARDTTAEATEKADLFAAITSFLRERARERATIVTIEDLHWSDATTMEYLGYVASRIAGTRLLLIATYRSEACEGNDALSATIARAMRESTTFRIDLRTLKGAQIRALLDGALEGHVALDRPTLDTIVARAEGNPFFGEELLKSALEQAGYEGRSPPLPISIRASIVERLRSFSQDERVTIERAAVLGVRFDPHVLARTMNVPVETILPALRRARDANLIVEEDGERVRFRFRHALTRQAVYDNLLLFDARRTHQAILVALEAFDAENDYMEELAYHAWEARDLVKARRYNERAGDRAFSLFALPEARACFERALETAPCREDEAPLLERLSRVNSLLGHIPTALGLYEAAIAAFVELEDFGRAAVIVAWSAADRNNTGDATAVAFGTAFLERFGSRIPVAQRDQLIAMLARIAMISYHVEVASELLARIEAPHALTAPARQNVLLAESEIAWVAGDARRWADVAIQIVDTLPALSTFTQLGTGYTIAQAASYAMRDDLVDRAFAQIDRVQARAEIGVLQSYGEAVRALDYFARGHLDGARDALRRTLDLPELHVSDTVLAGVAPFVADALDDNSLVPARLDALFADVRRNASHGDDVTILAGSAVWLLRHGRRSEALADLRRGLCCIPRPLASSWALLTLAARHFDVAQLTSLAPYLDVAAYDPQDPVACAHARALAAIVARRNGDDGRAVDLGTLAARSYGMLGRPLLEARALETAGRIDDARALYVRHGAVGYAKALTSQASEREPLCGVLSERESTVAAFVAAGLGNTAIAERLSISKKTVEKHVGSIYDKLGVRTRAQLAGLIASDDPRTQSGKGELTSPQQR